MSDRGIIAALADSICRGDKPTSISIEIDAEIEEHRVPISVRLDPSDLQDMEIIKKKIQEKKDEYKEYMRQFGQLTQMLQQQAPYLTQAYQGIKQQPAFGGGFTTTWGNPYTNTTTTSGTSSGYLYGNTLSGWTAPQIDPLALQQTAWGQANQHMNQYLSLRNNATNPYLLGQTADGLDITYNPTNGDIMAGGQVLGSVNEEATSGKQKVTRAAKKIASSVKRALKYRSQRQEESDD